MIKERFLKLITNDFEGDTEFIEERLPRLLSQAETKLINLLGTTAYKSFKQNAPQEITSVTDNEDGTITLAITDASKFSADGIVFYDITDVYRESTYVVSTDEDANTITVWGETFTLDAEKTYKIMSQMYNDIVSAGAYLTAYYAVSSLIKITQEGSGINSLNFGNEVKTFSNIEEAKKQQNLYFNQAIELANPFLDEDSTSPKFKIAFI